MVDTASHSTPLSSLACVGLNHHRTPIDIREKIAFNDVSLQLALRQIINLETVHEATIINTCNRVEFYISGDPLNASHHIKQFVSQFHGVDHEMLEPHLYTYIGTDALTQLFRMASSLDSQIVGEPQILGQVKKAFGVAQEVKTVGPVLTRAFSHAFFTAKRIRAETKIGEQAVTVGFAAVSLAKKVFGDLRNRQCLLIGAGEMGQLIAQLLLDRGADITVASRTLEKAKELAIKYNGHAIELSHIDNALQHTDIVLTTTAAFAYLFNKNQVLAVMPNRRFRPLFFIDIAVPRNTDPTISDLDGVYVYNIDDLKLAVELNLDIRQTESNKAETLVDEEVRAYIQKLNEQKAVPLIKSIKEKGSMIAQKELERSLPLLGPLSPEQRKQISSMAIAIINKMLHKPLTTIRSTASNGDEKTEELLKAAHTLFGIEQSDDDS